MVLSPAIRSYGGLSWRNCKGLLHAKLGQVQGIAPYKTLYLLCMYRSFLPYSIFPKPHKHTSTYQPHPKKTQHLYTIYSKIIDRYDRSLDMSGCCSVVQAVKDRPDSSGMAFSFCGLSRFCGLCGCHFDSAQ